MQHHTCMHSPVPHPSYFSNHQFTAILFLSQPQHMFIFIFMANTILNQYQSYTLLSQYRACSMFTYSISIRIYSSLQQSLLPHKTVSPNFHALVKFLPIVLQLTATVYTDYEHLEYQSRDRLAQQSKRQHDFNANITFSHQHTIYFQFKINFKNDL